jgi:hypothetical protein
VRSYDRFCDRSLIRISPYILITVLSVAKYKEIVRDAYHNAGLDQVSSICAMLSWTSVLAYFCEESRESHQTDQG